MYRIDFQKPLHVHFIGIGGISMSGLAAVLLKEGFTVSGSDARESSLTELLRSYGARVMIGQKADNIPSDCELVVYTAAIHPDNPEFARAKELGLPMLTRAQLLGEIMTNYEMPVAVSGTHGKTTTTSMLSQIAMEGGLDPTISVGGILQSIGGNIRVGSSGTFITEACEYTNSFLSFYPKLSIILNIDADHLDFFKDLAQIRRSFRSFAELLPAEGCLVINHEIENLAEITDGLACKVITYGPACEEPGSGSETANHAAGAKQPDYAYAHVSFDENGCGSFDLYKGTSMLGRFTLRVPGIHNVSNASAAIAAADLLGISAKDMQAGLLSFTGADRRFEKKGMFGNVTVIDDYAHHPTEIRATLTAAREYPHREIWCAIQPHTYTRTFALLDEFADALSMADHVVLADIYAAREKNEIGISSRDLQAKLLEKGCDAAYFPSFEEIGQYLADGCRDGDLLITMGAGDIYLVGERLVAGTS